MYTIKYWETEECRDAGYSEVFGQEDNLPTAIEVAQNLFYRQDFAAVEVENKDGNVRFHISTDTPKGEYF